MSGGIAADGDGEHEGRARPRRRAFELVVAWGDDVLTVLHRVVPLTLHVGHDVSAGACDVVLPEELFGAPRLALLEAADDGPARLAVPFGATGGLRLPDGGTLAFADIANAGKGEERSADRDTVVRVAVPAGAWAEVVLAQIASAPEDPPYRGAPDARRPGIVLRIREVDLTRGPGRSVTIPTRALAGLVLAAAAHVGVLAYSASEPPEEQHVVAQRDRAFIAELVARADPRDLEEREDAPRVVSNVQELAGARGLGPIRLVRDEDVCGSMGFAHPIPSECANPCVGSTQTWMCRSIASLDAPAADSFFVRSSGLCGCGPDLSVGLAGIGDGVDAGLSSWPSTTGSLVWLALLPPNARPVEAPARDGPFGERGRRPARSRLGAVTSIVRGGDLSAEIVQRAVRSKVGRLRLCYERGSQIEPRLRGVVTVRFIVGRDGAESGVGTFEPGTDLPDRDVVSCVTQAFRNVTLPAPENGVAWVEVRIPFSPG